MAETLHEQMKWDETPKTCSVCGEPLVYKCLGEYRCEACGNIDRDDFGKVRHFLDENGPTPALLISEKTGVALSKINQYLRQGRVEIPDGSSVYIKCEVCGKDIRFGRYCPECAVRFSKSMQGTAVTGDIPKHTAGAGGEMRFFGKEKKRY